MRKQITIIGDAIQYGDLGQLHLSDCILCIDNLIAIRGDVALKYLRDKLVEEGKLLPEQLMEKRV